MYSQQGIYLVSNVCQAPFCFFFSPSGQAGGLLFKWTIWPCDRQSFWSVSRVQKHLRCMLLGSFTEMKQFQFTPAQISGTHSPVQEFLILFPQYYGSLKYFFGCLLLRALNVMQCLPKWVQSRLRNNFPSVSLYERFPLLDLLWWVYDFSVADWDMHS